MACSLPLVTAEVRVAGAYSVDAALRLARSTTALFLASVVVGLAMVWAGTRPAA